MCTTLARITDEHMIVLWGPTCCLSVEDIEEIQPKISRTNGWTEIFVGGIGYVKPKWTNWVWGEAQACLPHNLAKRTASGKKIISLSFQEDLLALCPPKPIAELNYRGTLIGFSSYEQIQALHDFIASKDRKAHAFAPFERYLAMLPKVILGKADRPKVLKKLQKLRASFEKNQTR